MCTCGKLEAALHYVLFRSFHDFPFFLIDLLNKQLGFKKYHRCIQCVIPGPCLTPNALTRILQSCGRPVFDIHFSCSNLTTPNNLCLSVPVVVILNHGEHRISLVGVFIKG